ncbi:MAG: flavodoxin-dependent (E)-4-hydroxy-3-methylbut-2-enyl-diphosphate synthase, partial [Holosporales bacterium]|nr:flavodoxin-dependent (E)-4-hydroxy-3-methylbut-2-enyl-diphosphate synthase [Holosporales bacterium]
MFSKKQISIGNIEIGGNAPVSIQTMTNTNTENVQATVAQIELAKEAGCDLIRISCPTRESTVSLREILKIIKEDRSVDLRYIPVIADVHFNYKRAIEAIDAGVHGIRINPGNIDTFGLQETVKALNGSDCALRIGINSGSIERDILNKYGEPTAEALVESAVLSCKKLE